MEHAFRTTARTTIDRPVLRSAGGSRWLVGAGLGTVLLVAAACGSSGASAPTSTRAHTSPLSGKSAVVSVAGSHQGSLGLVLVDQSGMTLYRFSPDGTGQPTCTGSCAAAWPPLTVPAGTTHVAGTAGVSSSDLGTVLRPGGALQVSYKGMPLYRFSDDAAPGDTKGQGVAGTWFVVPVMAASMVTPSTASPPTTTAAATVPPASSSNGASTGAAVPPSTAPPTMAPPATPPATSPPATAPPATSPPATQPSGGGYGY
jgi:predicted lipoprotein with Yx(FWY)xxD motif